MEPGEHNAAQRFEHSIRVLAIFLLSHAIPKCRAGIGSRLSAIEVLWAYIWQLAVLHQPTSERAVSGACLVMLAVVLLAAAELRKEAAPDAKALVAVKAPAQKEGLVEP